MPRVAIYLSKLFTLDRVESEEILTKDFQISPSRDVASNPLLLVQKY